MGKYDWVCTDTRGVASVSLFREYLEKQQGSKNLSSISVENQKQAQELEGEIWRYRSDLCKLRGAMGVGFVGGVCLFLTLTAIPLALLFLGGGGYSVHLINKESRKIECCLAEREKIFKATI